MAQDLADTEVPRRRGFFVRVLRFFAWCGAVVSALVLAGTVAMYAPCFAGEADACISGVLILLPGAFVLVVGGISALILLLTRGKVSRPAANTGA